MQRTQNLWLHALSTSENWVADINWMNSKKQKLSFGGVQ